MDFAYELESSFHEFCCFVYCFGGFADEVVVFGADQLSVDQGVFDVFVAEKLHDVEDVFGLVVFGGGFPMAESVKGDLG